MPSDVPAVMKTRSAATGKPVRVYSAATASRAAGIPADGPYVLWPSRIARVDRLDQMRRRLEPEGDRIADIEIADARACRLNFLGLGDDIPNGVGEAVNARGGWYRRRGPGGCHARILLRPDTDAVSTSNFYTIFYTVRRSAYRRYDSINFNCINT